MIDIVEDIGGRLIDRHGARAGYRIGPLTGMQAEAVELERFGIGHGIDAFEEETAFMKDQLLHPRVLTIVGGRRQAGTAAHPIFLCFDSPRAFKTGKPRRRSRDRTKKKAARSVSGPAAYFF
jgi:hypothetical protein